MGGGIKCPFSSVFCKYLRGFSYFAYLHELVNHYVLFYLSRARPWRSLNTYDCDQPSKKYMYSSDI